MTTLIDDGLRSLIHQMPKSMGSTTIVVYSTGLVIFRGGGRIQVRAHLSDPTMPKPSEVIASWSKK